VTGADVENGVIGPQLGLVEHRVADRVQELVEQLLACFRIATETHVQQPPLPAVRSVRHNRAFCLHSSTSADPAPWHPQLGARAPGLSRSRPGRHNRCYSARFQSAPPRLGPQWLWVERDEPLVRVDRRYNQPYRLTGYALRAIFS